MRTSIDIEETLLRRAERHALDHATTLNAIVEEGLRRVVADKPTGMPYVFDPPTVHGQGLQDGLREGDWDAIRELIYPVPEDLQK